MCMNCVVLGTPQQLWQGFNNSGAVGALATPAGDKLKKNYADMKSQPSQKLRETRAQIEYP